MSRNDDDRLPGRIEADLKGLVPGLPEAIGERDRNLLDMAHGELGRSGRRKRWGIWAAGGAMAAAAALAVGVTLWQVRPEPAQAPVAAVQQQRPTIVDAMIAARRGAKPAEVDQIAMAAVRLDGGMR